MLLSGAVPTDLRGTLFRVGPSPVRRGGVLPAHILDGDGRIDKVTFRNGHVSTHSRLIETPDFLEEQKADAFLKRGAFGTAPHVSLRHLKNTSNTALVWHAGHLLALWEGGSACQIDPRTLDCLGPHTLGGAACTAPPFSLHGALDASMGVGGDAVGAHPVRDPVTGRLVVMLSTYSLGSTRIRLLEFEKNSWKVSSERVASFNGFTLVHSFGLTPDHYVFFAPPLEFDAWAFRRGKGVLEAVSQREGGVTRLVRLPRSGGRPTVKEAPFSFATHVTHATDTSLTFFSVNQLALPKFTAQRASWTTNGRVRAEVLDGRVCEFPNTFGKHMYYSGSQAAPMDSWIRMDTETREVLACTTPGRCHLECTYVPSPSGGYLVGFSFSGEKNFLNIVDAATMHPLACVDASGLNITGLHSIFCAPAENDQTDP
jgi:hypothetical protein